MFSHIIGNDHIKTYLTRMVETASIGNSLLFAGPEGVGKSLFALALGKALIAIDDPDGSHARKADSGKHPDIRQYRPEGKLGMHSIETMRQFNDEVYLAPFEAKWKIFIIHEAHRMLPYSSNALLKTFEEPAKNTLIIMLSSAPETLLSTILSRCRTLHFHRLEEEQIVQFLLERQSCQADEARRIAQLSEGSLGRALHLQTNGRDNARKSLLDFLTRGKAATYSELLAFVKDLCQKVESTSTETESAMKDELLQGIAMNDLSAYQKQLVVKEVEGAVAMRHSYDAYCLFDTILSWYRDMHLLYLAGNHHYLVNKDYEAELQAKVLEAEPPPLEFIQKAVADARISLARSTALTICLENLFLKLNMI